MSEENETDVQEPDNEMLLPDMTRIRRYPKDRFNVVYLVFYALGVGSLLPWNFLAMQNSWLSSERASGNQELALQYKLRNTTIASEASWTDSTFFTQEQILFENYLELAALVPSILFMFINVTLTNIVSIQTRIVTSLLIMLVLFVFTVVLAKVNTDAWQHVFLIISLITVVIMNAASAVLQGGMCGLAGKFPEKYMQAVMGGMGMGGVGAAVASVLVTATGSSPLSSGFSYFVIAGVCILVCLISYLSLPFLDFVKFHTSKNEVIFETDTTVVSSDENDVSDSADVIIQPPQRSVMSDLGIVLKQIWVYALTVCFTFAVTLSCFPAVNASIQSVHAATSNNAWTNIYFTPVTCFLLFNICDWTGRTLAGILHWPEEGSVLLPLISILRLVFPPIFLFCNVQPRTHTSVFFTVDWVPILFTCLFGFTNGHIGTLCMMYAPRRVTRENVELAGSTMSFFLGLGLALGAIISFPLMRLV